MAYNGATTRLNIVPEKSIKTVNALKREYKNKGSWITRFPKSDLDYYYLVLSNLTGEYLDSRNGSVGTIREYINKGLPRETYLRLKELTNFTAHDLSIVMGVPERTLARRKVFKPDESERIIRIAKVFQHVLEVFGDLDSCRRWVSSPKKALGGKSPFEYCDTEPGAREVENLIGRIEHGVFS